MEKYKIIKLKGKGQFAKVFKIKELKSRENYAVKTFKITENLKSPNYVCSLINLGVDSEWDLDPSRHRLCLPGEILRSVWGVKLFIYYFGISWRRWTIQSHKWWGNPLQWKNSLEFNLEATLCSNLYA